MKYKQQMIFGICASIFVWVIFILADLIDEYILGSGLLIGAISRQEWKIKYNLANDGQSVVLCSHTKKLIILC